MGYVVLSVVAGFCEELIFRLSAIPALIVLGTPAWFAWVIASVAFVLIHGRAARGSFGLYLFFKGMLYGLIFLWTGSLVWPFAVHALSDMLLLLRPQSLPLASSAAARRSWRS